MQRRPAHERVTTLGGLESTKRIGRFRSCLWHGRCLEKMTPSSEAAKSGIWREGLDGSTAVSQSRGVQEPLFKTYDFLMIRVPKQPKFQKTQ